MIKINLPNPREMTVQEFFAQMKIALKSAEKSYEEMIKGLDDKDLENNNPWISFRISNFKDCIGEYQNAIPLNEIEDEWQEILLEIDRL